MSCNSIDVCYHFQPNRLPIELIPSFKLTKCFIVVNSFYFYTKQQKIEQFLVVKPHTIYLCTLKSKNIHIKWDQMIDTYIYTLCLNKNFPTWLMRVIKTFLLGLWKFSRPLCFHSTISNGNLDSNNKPTMEESDVWKKDFSV